MNKPSIAELHAQFPVDWDEREWRDPTHTLDQAIAEANELHEQDDILGYLEALHDQDYSRMLLIHRAMLFLPPQVIYDYYGQDVAMWLSLRSVISHDNDEVNEVLTQHGVSPEDLETARLWTWHHRPFDSTARRELGLYGVMQSMKHGLLDGLDLSPLLEECAAPGVALNAKRLGDYAVTAIWPDEYNYVYSGGRVERWQAEGNSIDYPIWLDAPTGFALTYKDTPQAVGGISMSSERDMMIHQIQGVKGKRIDRTKRYYEDCYYEADVSARGLAPLDWRKAVVRIAEWVGRQTDVERMAIEAGAHNAWTTTRGRYAEPHLPVDVAKKIYDATAQRLGYVRADHDDWYKQSQ